LSAESLQFSSDEEFLRRRVVLDTKYIGLAADLAIFDLALAASRRLIHGRDIPLSAGRALEAGFHTSSIHSPNLLRTKALDAYQQALKISPDLIEVQQTAATLPLHSRNDAIWSNPSIGF